MTPFARLLSDLVLAPARGAKLRLLAGYFSATPDPDRGYALAALAGALTIASVKPAAVRGLAEARVDPALFRRSYDFVGDLAETVALIWPAPTQDPDTAAPRLGEVVATLAHAGRTAAPALLAGLLDRLGPDERFALVKLVGGAPRVGVSARLVKTALAELAAAKGVDAPLEAIEERWHGLAPPYSELFAWLEGRGPAPSADDRLAFRPMMLAQPLDALMFDAPEAAAAADEAETVARLEARLEATAFAAEWKWDGVRALCASDGHVTRLYSRTGEDVAAAFPELIEALRFDAAVDGELLVVAPDGAPAPFATLQKRLGRKAPTAALLRAAPAELRAYDLLREGGDDLRALPFAERRARLEAFVARLGSPRLALSPLVTFATWAELARLRGEARAVGQEGLMLKRRDSRYVGGRPMGPWFKWKRAPLSADCVLMYAQRGHGKRSSFYSDYTFGAWRDGPNGPELAPVGKAYSGYTDEELLRIDRWIRANTTERFGPVRAVTPALVFELAFDGVQRSTRHKSGVAMRFPRIARIRWDKPAAEADTVASLERMIGAPVQ